MPGESEGKEVADVHVKMWIHYDALRQQKTGSFLQANSILVAIAGFSFKDSPRLVWVLSPLGLVISIAWFLLLTRNASYIAYHRERVGQNWTPVSRTPHQNTLDRTLPVAFGVFWFVLLVLSFF